MSTRLTEHGVTIRDLKLEGEALDNHMMAMHGWSMQMVAVKGTQTLAQKHNYIGAMHLSRDVRALDGYVREAAG